MNDIPRTLTVSGHAEVRVPPNEVVVTVGVEVTEKELAKARREAEERTKRIIAAARAQGVDDRSIATDRIHIEPRYSSATYISRATREAYSVRRDLELTVRDVARFDDVLAAVLEAGANIVHGVRFRTNDLRKLRDQARELALKAASEKAAAMAQALQMRPGRPRTITEGPVGWWSGHGSASRGSGSGWAAQNVVQIAPTEGEGSIPGLGMIGVNASVTVVFDLLE